MTKKKLPNYRFSQKASRTQTSGFSVDKSKKDLDVSNEWVVWEEYLEKQ